MPPRPTLSSLPYDTLKTARIILGRENFYLKVGDNWETLLAGALSSDTKDGETTHNWMGFTLAIATLLQYKEKLSDRQAEEASRLRVDWKYALHLSIHHPGLSRVMLCQYRQRVYHNPARQAEFQAILDRFARADFYSDCQETPLSALALMDEVCTQSRLEEVLLILRQALEVLATNHPKWLRNIILPHWYSRYHLFKAAPDLPQTCQEQRALADTIGADILYLFKAISPGNQDKLREIEEIKALQRTWYEQFEPIEAGSARLLDRCSFCGSINSSVEAGE